MSLRSIVGIACGLAFPAFASADILANTFAGPGEGFQGGTGYLLGGGGGIQFARSFTISSGASFDSIEVPVFAEQDPGNFTASIRGSQNNKPGAIIEAFQGTLPLIDNNDPNPPGKIVTLQSQLHPILGPGTYFLVLSAGINFGVWCMTNDGHQTTLYSSGPANQWATQTSTDVAMRINGSPVPEPVSLLGLGLGCIVLLKKKRNFE